MLVELKVQGYRCQKCGHEWVPRPNRLREPRVCPKCKSAWFDIPGNGKELVGASGALSGGNS